MREAAPEKTSAYSMANDVFKVLSYSKKEALSQTGSLSV